MNNFSFIAEAVPLWQQPLLLYLGIMNLITFISYGLDKYYARKNRWRIPERRLILLAAAGGSAGALIGMRLFRHKTAKWKFRIWIPVFLVIHAGILLYLLCG